VTHHRSPPPKKKILRFYSGVRVVHKEGRYVVHPSNWLRLRLLLEPFEHVELLCVEAAVAGPDWRPFPDSVHVIPAQADFQPIGSPITFWKKVRFLLSVPVMVGRETLVARSRGLIGVIWLLEPLNISGLLVARLLRIPIYGVAIGSPKKAFLLQGSLRGSLLGRIFYGATAAVSGVIDRMFVRHSKLLLTTGPRLSAELGGGVAFSTSVYSLAEVTSREDTCQREEVVWVHCGGVSYHKGVDTFLLALAEVRRTDPRHRAVLVGRLDPAFPLDELVRDLGLEDAVSWTGYVPWSEGMAILRASDLCVFLSRHEGMPKAPLEAMAQGLPVIAATSGAEQYLEHGVNGLLVPVGDVAATVAAVTCVVGDGDFRRRIIAAALDTAREHTHEAALEAVGREVRAAFPHLTAESKTDWDAAPICQ
jgi:glycosyltransferase involved in cell wall biosynthesis